MTLRLLEIAIYNFSLATYVMIKFSLATYVMIKFSLAMYVMIKLYTHKTCDRIKFYVCTICAEYVSGVLVKLSLI